MKITLISMDFIGYDSYIIKELINRGIDANHINLKILKISYPNVLYKIINFFTKSIFFWNFKNKFQKRAIEKELNKVGIQDHILVIRADLLTDESLSILKKYTTSLIAFHYDCTTKFPRIIKVSSIFDRVYSFEKKDCIKYGYKFITNYIYSEIEQPSVKYKFTLFNVSSNDGRTPLIEDIAKKLNKYNFRFYIRIVGKFNFKYKKIKNIIYTKEYITLNEVKKLLSESMIILDINIDRQEGLSFRFFEALAKSKKIITTNQSIKEYDFYNKNNIMIINKNNIELDPGFFNIPYQPIEENILSKYTLKHWVNQIFEFK